MTELQDQVFAALADPTRRRILERLHDGAQPVEQLASGFAMSRPAVSKHLAALRTAGLVRHNARGRQNFYALERDTLAEADAWLRQFWSGRLALLKRVSEGDS